MLCATLNWPGSVPGLAPGHQQLSVRRILVHARIAVAVADVDLALRRERRVGAAVKGQAAHVGRGLARHADLEQHLAVGRALPHEVAAVVGAVEVVVRIDVQAVGARERAFAPGREEISVAIEHDHRVLAAIEHVDAILAVDRHRGGVLEFPAFGQPGPVFHHLIAVLAAAQDCAHRVSPLRRSCSD